MHIYMAAVYTNAYKPGQGRYEKLNDRERQIVETIPHILESWHYVGRQRFVDEMRADGAKVFLDSGAFSMWSQAKKYGTKLDLNVGEYCDYINRNRDILRVEDGTLMASVLDGIGDPLQTYRNQLEMEAYGVKALPCFHFGEDERYLDYYLNAKEDGKTKYDYITIGGMVGKTKQELITWLDRIFDRYIIDGTGKPRVKLHGFGITTVSIMERYPWYSCDSSSWIQGAAFGTVVHPRIGALSVSTKSPSRHDQGRHVSTLSPIEREYVEREFEKQGFTFERLSTVYESRAAYNLWSYCELNHSMSQEQATKTQIMELF
jgi:hypothetical protein